ncbi:hypothetical protein BsWGS_19743 [Bradybaena similaris]
MMGRQVEESTKNNAGMCKNPSSASAVIPTANAVVTTSTIEKLDVREVELDANLPCNQSVLSKKQGDEDHDHHHDDVLMNALLCDPLLHRRGPDVSRRHVIPLAENLNGYMQGCVLHLRGHLTPQPVYDASGNVFMWNGEVFDGIQVTEHENDTQVLFSHLDSCLTEDDVLKTMQKVHGPWAFIFWQANTRKLWFGRDMFGRRSLLWHLPLTTSDQIVLTSVALGDMAYTEIPSVGIFCLDYSQVSTSSGDASACPILTLYPWKDCRWPGTFVPVAVTDDRNMLAHLYPNLSTCIPVRIDRRNILDSWMPDINKNLPATDVSTIDNSIDVTNCISLEDMLTKILNNRSDLDALADELIHVLQLSVDKRVKNLPRNPTDSQYQTIREYKNSSSALSAGQDNEVGNLHFHESESPAPHANVAVLFSGGLDSTVLAALADRCVPEGEPIDLLNVAFEQSVTTNGSKKKTTKKQKKQTRFQKTESIQPCLTDISPDGVSEPDKIKPHEPNSNKHHCEHVDTYKVPDPHSSTDSSLNGCSAADLSTDKDLSSPMLHSLGSDQAHLSTKNCNCFSCAESCNCFSCADNCSKNVANKSCALDKFNVPDRQTGVLALSELNPKRVWNFVEINISQTELQDLRKSHIRKLIYPLQTVLDDSIGCAVWFAARGSGVLLGKSEKFTSKARVILCGMAADEQFAGYSRHRVTFQTKGWEGLLKEMQEEMWRISARNLGRDDRIITDHGKESRFPFLDETFTQFVSSVPLCKRADLRLPRGVGDKLLLRLCAIKLGLLKTASQPKRAIQFGSRIAKLDRRKEKGSDVCNRLV